MRVDFRSAAGLLLDSPERAIPTAFSQIVPTLCLKLQCASKAVTQKLAQNGNSHDLVPTGPSKVISRVANGLSPQHLVTLRDRC